MNIAKKLAFLWSYSLLVIIIGSYYLGGPSWTWVGAAYVYVGVPILDALFGKDRRNVSHDAYDEVLNNRYFDVLVYSFVYLHYALLGWGAYILTTEPLTGFQGFRLMISIGLFGGTIINIAHELGHRSSRVAQIHAKIALASVCYMHFFIEHNRGHHVHVATPLDPATSRLNQTVYAFWWQSIKGSYLSAWQIERKLLAKAGQAVWSRHNNMLWFSLWPVVVCSILTGAVSLFTGSFAWIVPVFFLVQSLM
ncbi:MAG: alkane 1-monooxygenase, partial [Rudanella sp.]|nr:alkane 1-monooxygenase [Rudanella sp.]